MPSESLVPEIILIELIIFIPLNFELKSQISGQIQSHLSLTDKYYQLVIDWLRYFQVYHLKKIFYEMDFLGFIIE
jgi:hypothetical protein